MFVSIIDQKWLLPQVVKHEKLFFSETTGPLDTKLSRNVS